MLLKRIKLKNFRQFYGEQKLEVASNTSENVTLIHAENGVGKTTILNAILWCFYKVTTERFEHPTKIANHQAISEGDYTVEVEVTFDSDNEEHFVSRSLNEHTNNEEFKAFLVRNGNYTPLDAPSVFINSVIPREMARYFFFDGEYAESFSSQNNKATVREALEDMLGCRTANQAVKDLTSLKSEFEKQIAALTKNDQSSVYQTQIDKLESAKEKNEAEIIVLTNNLNAAEDARDEITEKLRNAEGASTIQKKREEFEREREQIISRKTKSEAELSAWINDSGIGLIAVSLKNKTQKLLEDAKLKGKIPSYIAETFVHDILEQKLCICDRPFEGGSNEAEAIEQLLEDAGTALATDRLMNARTLMGVLSEKYSAASSNLDRIRQQIKDCTGELDSIEGKIEECHSQLKGSDVIEISERENALKERHEEIKSLNERINRHKFDCESWSREIDDNKKKRDRMLQTNEKAKALQKRCLLISKTIDKIEHELIKYREESRNTITDKVNEILHATARRDYIATIDEKFNLDMLYRETHTPVARSGGENQLLSLSFIAALIQFSANRIESSTELLKPGTSAPMVLDSPFGQLDPTYQKSTAEFLPLMSGQVILLLSQTQGNPEVMKILQDKIGAEYVLISENTGPQGDKPSDKITIHGREMDCSLYNCEKNQTRIMRL